MVLSLKLYGQQLNLHDYSSKSPLHVACSKGHFNVVKYLIKQSNLLS